MIAATAAIPARGLRAFEWHVSGELASPRAAAVSAADYERLIARRLAPPVSGAAVRHVSDTFAEPRGARRHEAVDVVAAHGAPVVAVEDGVIAKLFVSAAGGLTVYQFDPDVAYCYYYAHLHRYAEGLREGQAVRRGQPIGYVGATGNAPTGVPHLHFAIFKLGPEKRWWEGTPLDPYPIVVAGMSDSSMTSPTSSPIARRTPEATPSRAR